MYNCPKCAGPFEKGEKACKNCGFDIEKGFIYDPICPRCGRKYPDGTRFCEDDETKLIPFINFTPRCALCQRTFTPDVTTCPYDGGPIRPIIGGQLEKDPYVQREAVEKLAYYSAEEGYIYPKAPKGLRYRAYYHDNVRAGFFIVPVFILFVIFAISFPNYFAFFAYMYLILGVLGTIINILMKDTFQEGQSRGKKKYGLMIVDLKTNMPCSKKKSIQRNIPLIIPIIGNWEELIVLSSPKGQRLGDEFCNTQVIEIDQYAPELGKQQAPSRLHDASGARIAKK